MRAHGSPGPERSCRAEGVHRDQGPVPDRGWGWRAALGAAFVYLRLNGVTPSPDGPEWEELVLDVAASRLDRAGTSQRLRKLL